MEIKPKTAPVKGPPEMFTGDVSIEPIAYGEEPSKVRVNLVRFAPSARTAWHSHALGQTLYVTEGVGLMQQRGGAVTEMRVGDVVFTPSDEWHWHGASADVSMAHISVTEGVGQADRPESEWGEHVTDDEYRGHASG